VLDLVEATTILSVRTWVARAATVYAMYQFKGQHMFFPVCSDQRTQTLPRMWADYTMSLVVVVAVGTETTVDCMPQALVAKGAGE
jgi:hypothetical protein